MIISRWIIVRMRNVAGKSCRESQSRFFVQLLFLENLAFCAIMWKKKHGRAGQATDDNMAHAHYLPDNKGRNTDTHSKCVLIPIACPRQQLVRERASTLRYTYIASPVKRTQCNRWTLRGLAAGLCDGIGVCCMWQLDRCSNVMQKKFGRLSAHAVQQGNPI